MGMTVSDTGLCRLAWSVVYGEALCCLGVTGFSQEVERSWVLRWGTNEGMNAKEPVLF